MSNNAIHIKGLNFGYNSSELVIKNLNLSVPNGSIYGFLGANGAGKTTTLKMILRLIKSYKGDISIFGLHTQSSYPQYLKEIGSLIESPSFYGHLSAANNLKIWSNYFQADHKRIPHVLKLVDLTAATNKKTELFSTGMKQRLGLAAALLHDPQLLILDEPTNGLDPMGIIDLRKVISRLSSEGKTIMLSSHILSEVERIVTHLGILKDGDLIFEGTIDQLHGQRNQNIELTIQVDNPKMVIELMPENDLKVNSEKHIMVILNEKEDIPDFIKNMIKHNIKIYEVKQNSKNLEDMFLSISEESQT